jgi:hypothetical protein
LGEGIAALFRQSSKNQPPQFITECKKVPRFAGNTGNRDDALLPLSGLIDNAGRIDAVCVIRTEETLPSTVQSAAAADRGDVARARRRWIRQQGLLGTNVLRA